MVKVQATATEAIVAFGSLVMRQKNYYICCLIDQGAKASKVNHILTFCDQLLV
jgi:hypothetical protein